MKSFFNVRVPAALSTILSVLWLSISLGHAQTPDPAPDPIPAPTPQPMLSGFGDVPIPPFGDVQAQYNSYEVDMLGDDLVGDHTDGDTGGLSLTQTDVSIPGNSALPVSFGRQRSRSGLRGSWLADWTPTIPSISKHFLGGYGPNIDRCTNDLLPNPIQGNGGGQYTINALAYFTGYHLDIPGRNPGPLVGVPNGGPSPEFPSNARLVSKNNWVVTCTANVLSGGEGFLATAPNGDKYTFGFQKTYYERDISLPAYDSSLPPSQTNPNFDNTSADEQVYKEVLYVTKIEDVHGNYVNYEYANGRPSRIIANDGRQITFGYSGSLISSVVANGRTWTYQYVTGSLIGVTLPDGRSWSIDADSVALDPWVTSICAFSASTIDPVIITHPDGATAQFDFEIIKNGRTHMDAVLADPGASDPTVSDCFLGDHSGGSLGKKKIPSGFYSFAVTKKTLTVPNVGTYIWTREYEEDFPSNPNWAGSYTDAMSHPSDIKTRTITDPLGHKTVMHYNRRNGPLEGALTKVEIIPSGTTTPIKVTDYSYLGGHLIGIDLSAGGALSNGAKSRPIYQTKLVVSQDGDSYTTDMVYNQTPTSTAYSYGKPIQTSVYSSVSTTPRVTDITYVHRKPYWIIGLTNSVAVNSVPTSGFTYNSLGLTTAQTRFGVTVQTLSYNSDGTIDWVDDALGRRTRAQSWKRGQPQTVIYPDSTSMSRIVDNNGWVTSLTDPKSNITTYSRDTMGRLTLINPPASYFSNTSIAYNLTGPGVVQTITRGNSEAVITHDSLLRPILAKSRDTSTGWESYVKTSYDALNRPIFTSFPSASSSPTSGTTMIYDALGRTKTQAENVTPFATTSYAYLSSNRTAVTDPALQVTTTWKDGYSGPGVGDVIKIQQPENVTTDLARNIWGLVSSVTQSGGGATTTRNYYYDASQRLCRYVTPEAGHTVYKYDNANQLTSYARAAAAGTSCITPTGVERVLLTYWPRGGLRATAFNDGVTRDIERTYDANDNLTKVYRGSSGDAVNWDYEYDVMNNLTREKLTTDGRIYDTTYVYNPLSHITQKTLPGGFVINSVPDALGRDKTVQIGSSNLATSAVYHAGGFLSTMNYANGHAYALTPDARLKPARIRASKTGTLAFDQQYSYTPRGQISGVTDLADSGNTRSYGYDNLGRLATASGPWGAGSFTYDALGNLKTKARGTRSVTNVYDAPSNRLIRSLDNLPLASGGQGDRWIAYDGRGNMQQFGTTWLAYDKNYQMTSSAATASGTTTSYKYDGNQKRVRLIAATPSAAMASGGGSRESASAFSVDVSRLTSAARTSESRSKSSLSPSEVSDILESMLSTATEGRSDLLSLGTAEQMMQRARPVYADRARGGFDAYKEVEATPEKESAAESLSPAVSASTASAMASPGCTGPTDKTIFNVYNAQGQLALVDKAHLCKMTLYIRGAGMSLARIEVDTVALTYTRTYLHPDQLGSATAGTSQSGAVLWREQYAPYGDKLTAPAANDDLGSFTGHIDDDATTDMNLAYMQARYYDPGAGRFTSVDPVTFLGSGYDPRYVSRYSYAGNDPVSNIDPDGQFFGLAGKVLKLAIKGGDVGATVSGAVADTKTIFSKDATGLQRLGAVASLATEVFSPISARDAKAGVKLAQKRLSKTCCFVAGTPVKTEYGLRSIEDIKIGDLVLARNPETGETALKPVTDLIRRHERVIWRLSVEGGNETAEIFETTDDHPWWVVADNGGGHWVSTQDLISGMFVTTADNRTMTISAVTETERTDVTYNLTVADFETYFVGVNKVLVHNCPTGSYTNTHASGKTYDGKGDPNRAAISGRRVANENNDPHLNTETRTASTERESFKQESRSLDQNGGPSSDGNYNKIDSPGKKYREEDGELD